MVRFGKVAVDHVQLAPIQRSLDSIDVLVVGIGQIALVVALQIVPDAGVLPAVAAGLKVISVSGAIRRPPTSMSWSETFRTERKEWPLELMEASPRSSARA